MLLTAFAPAFDPYENLAAEEILARVCASGERILYLWINDPCVVLGFCQNPWVECNTELMRRAGVLPVRRKSGGGAVYHDRGNLNFTVISPRAEFDPGENFALLLGALSSVGVNASVSGRNDLTAGGRKFSGSAFSHAGEISVHHGTMLVSADLAAAAACLTPSPGKLAAKGIKSAASRMVNLSELAPVSCESLSEAIVSAFEEKYGAAVPAPFLPDSALAAEYASPEFIFGATPPFDAELTLRGADFEATLRMCVEKGVIARVKVYTDALDTGLAARLERAVAGAKYDAAALAETVRRI